MLHLLQGTINPRLQLSQCLKNWCQISMDLREPPRTLSLQTEHLDASLLSP